MRRTNRAVYLVMLTLTLMFMSACSEEPEVTYEVPFEDMEGIRSQASVNGLDVVKLERSLMTFAEYVFAPKSQDEQNIGLQSIKEYCTESLYKTLQGDMAGYVEGNSTDFGGCKVDIGAPHNQRDGLGRAMVTFVVVDTSGTNVVEVEFTIDNFGLLSEYNVYTRKQ